MTTKIEWCDLTINPIVGCSKISPGCKNCYAEKMAYRLKCMGIPKYQNVVDKNGWTGEIGVDFSCFNNLPKKPKRIFVGSMGDLFHENVHESWIDEIFKKIGFEYIQHTFIILTKRPKKAKLYFERLFKYNKKIYPNVWIGITCENQETADERIPVLLQIPAQVWFVSGEPMLEKINIKRFLHPEFDICEPVCPEYNDCDPAECLKFCGWKGIDWVICGAETGPGKRPMDIEWAYDLQNQCDAAGVPFFFKKDSNGNFPEGFSREFPK